MRETVSALLTRWQSDLGSYGRLYETRPYLEAYAAHTDYRVVKDPHAAVGGSDACGLRSDFVRRIERCREMTGPTAARN